MSKYLEFRKPIVNKRPKGETPADLLRVLGDVALGKPLPLGWSVTQEWRNGPTKPWKSDSVERMVRASFKRGGDFVGIYLNRFLRPKAASMGVTLGEPREATEREAERAEDAMERVSAREAGEFAALRKFQLRSAAAKRGWVTRRRNQARTAKKRAKSNKRKR